jgi:hypothetical protein
MIALVSKRKRKSRRDRTPNLPSQATTAASRETTRRKQVDLAEEYAYVSADLGRIAMIAGVMLVGLVALSFILR